MKQVSPSWIFNLSKEGVTYIASLGQKRNATGHLIPLRQNPSPQPSENQRSSFNQDWWMDESRSERQGHLAAGQRVAEVTRRCHVWLACSGLVWLSWLAPPRLLLQDRTGSVWPMCLWDTLDSGTVSARDVIWTHTRRAASWHSSWVVRCARQEEEGADFSHRMSLDLHCYSMQMIRKLQLLEEMAHF